MYNDKKVLRKIFSEYFFTIYLKMYHKLKQNDKNIYKLILIKIAMSKTLHIQYLCSFARHGNLFYHSKSIVTVSSKWYN